MIGIVPSILSADFTRLGEQVRDLDLGRRCRISDIAHAYSGAAEPDARRRPRIIETGIVLPRRDDVLGAPAGQAFRDETADQKPRDRGIAVGKNVFMPRFPRPD